MFTGLIEATGQVITNLVRGNSNRLVIASTLKKLEIGESIAVNGVCLTLIPGNSKENELHFDLSPETLQVSTLAHLSCGETVNLERALCASTRFGGHYVSGHVDTTAQIASMRSIDECMELELTGFSVKAMLYLIPKGSITIEGVSLTINRVINQNIQLMLIPHTLSHTTLGLLKINQRVNIEFDSLARMVAHQLQLLGKLNSEVNL